MARLFKRPSVSGALLGAMLIGGPGLSSVGCEDNIDVVQETLPPEATPPEFTPTPTPYLEKHLTILPDTLEFGAVPLRCQELKEVRIINDSIKDVRIFGIAPAGGTTAEFSVTPYTNITLASFDSLTVPIAYSPVDPGIDNGVVLVQSDVPSQPTASIGLSGQDGGGGEALETFIQPPGTPVDFVWLVDISGSMGGEIDEVIANFDRFMKELSPLLIDYQMALLTTSLDDEGNFQGTYGEEGKPWISRDMGEEVVAEFLGEMKAASRGSSTDERGIDTNVLAFKEEKLAGYHNGFIRDNARLVVTVFSDEDDHSAATPGSLINRMKEIKPNLDIVYNAVVGTTQVSESSCHDETGDRYIDIAKYFDGIIENVCASSYSNLMATLGEYAAAAESIFHLTGQPESAYGFVITVTPVDGEPAVVETGYSYDAAENAIVFAPEAIPPAGAEVRIEYVEGGSCL